MRALTYHRYGPPEVLAFVDLPQPVPQGNQVLIKVRATTVNRTDTGLRAVDYFVSRFFTGLLRPRRQFRVLGSEFSGEIVAIGPAVRAFKVSDAVFGLSTQTFGAHAEYLCLPETGSLALKPAHIPHSAAAASGEGPMLALNFLRAAKLSCGHRLLINGASGSIGTAALQLGKQFGATVTAVGKTESLDRLLSLGADRVIDYTTTDFTRCGETFEVIFDAVGKSTFFRCRHLLKPGGIYTSTEFGPWAQNPWLAIASNVFGGLGQGQRVRFPIPSDNQADIQFFAGLLAAGTYRPVIDRTYPFSEIIEAVRYVETAQKIGNVVITL
jgi:NADPH:quinone reductase-like Zn-dependent oxidoreductase